MGGVCLSALSGAIRLLEPNPGCDPSWWTDPSSSSGIPLLPSLAPRYRFRHTDCLSSVSGLVPGGLKGAVSGCLGNHSRFGSRLLQPSFPGGRGSGGLLSHDRPLSPERVCSAISVHHSTCSPCASVYPRGIFPSIRSPCVLSVFYTRSSGFVDASCASYRFR